MELLIDFTLAIAVLCIVVMLVGLYKPWVTLWWRDTQNRKMVIRIYGTAGLLFFLLYQVLLFFLQSK